MRIRDYNRGYSLVEVLAVLSLISVLLIIGTPAVVDQMTHTRLKRGARDVITELNAGRLKAITKNTKYRVEFTLYASTATPDEYTLSIWNIASATWVDDSERPRRELPANVDITSPGANFNVEFYPNGTSTATSICLQNTGEASDRMKLSISGSTGQITIASGG